MDRAPSTIGLPPQPAAQPPHAHAAKPKAGLSTGAMVGIAVGVAFLGLILLGAIAAALSGGSDEDTVAAEPTATDTPSQTEEPTNSLANQLNQPGRQRKPRSPRSQPKKATLAPWKRRSGTPLCQV